MTKDPWQDPVPLPLRPVRDLEGLCVRDASGIPVGEVFGALTDADSGLLRYLDLSLNEGSRHVLVPIGHARLLEPEGRAHEIRLRAALLEELLEIPEFDPRMHLDEPFEQRLLRAHGRLFHGESYYAHPAYDHRGLYAGPNPLVRSTDGLPGEAGLWPLEDLPDYGVVSGEADVTGWPITGADGQPLGVVDDLIVDVERENVPYLAVEIGEAECVLVPVGFMHIDERKGRICAPSMMPEDLTALPRYSGGAVPREVEELIRETFVLRFSGDRRYQLPDFRAA